MAIKTFRPITPARRHMTVSTFEGLAKVEAIRMVAIMDEATMV